MNRIILPCVISTMFAMMFIGCDRISNDEDIQNQDSLEIITDTNTSTTQTLEDIQTSSMSISIDTVPLATNSTVETSVDNTTIISDTTSNSITTLTTVSNITSVSTSNITDNTTTSMTTLDTNVSTEYTVPNMLDLVEFTNDKNALPPLNDDLRTFFQDAFYTYYEFTSAGTIQVDMLDSVEVDDRYYSRVTDNRFSSIDEVSSYLSQYFTDDFIENSYILNKFVESDGNLYSSISAKGCDISYCGHTFEILEQSDEEISFQALVYFSTEGTWTKNSYFINDTPNIEYVTQLSRYILLNTQNGWRFDTFSPIY